MGMELDRGVMGLCTALKPKSSPRAHEVKASFLSLALAALVGSQPGAQGLLKFVDYVRVRDRLAGLILIDDLGVEGTRLARITQGRDASRTGHRVKPRKKEARARSFEEWQRGWHKRSTPPAPHNANAHRSKVLLGHLLRHARLHDALAQLLVDGGDWRNKAKEQYELEACQSTEQLAV